ncbi:FmdB family zinc ribbon protein [Sinomonas sp.]|uniref:FmdB family zinc ribbon protein n=1 Tax=Sinomonas sp. TaxID=1914986 RepID=UPI002FE2FF2A
MPTYAYACKDCGHAFDIVQSFSDDSLTACPECGGSLRKKFNSVGVVFKGSGFYRTDSRSSSTVPAGSNASPAGGDSSASAGKSAPAAPAPAPAATASASAN